MAKVKKKVLPAKRDTKGKQHASHAASWLRFAQSLSAIPARPPEAAIIGAIARAAKKEGLYLRTILR